MKMICKAPARLVLLSDGSSLYHLRCYKFCIEPAEEVNDRIFSYGVAKATATVSNCFDRQWDHGVGSYVD